MDSFISELNPISSSTANTVAKSSGSLDKFHERILYKKAIEEKSDAEIIALVIKQRTEAALEFQRSVDLSLKQLSSISSDFLTSNEIRRRMSFQFFTIAPSLQRHRIIYGTAGTRRLLTLG